MSTLSVLLEEAFKDTEKKKEYINHPWTLKFFPQKDNSHNFILSYQKDVLSPSIDYFNGNTSTKKLVMSNAFKFPLSATWLNEVEEALPDYHFNLKLMLRIPVDFNDDWTSEVHGVNEYVVENEYRSSDYAPAHGVYGYDEVSFNIGKISDLKNVIIEEKGGDNLKVGIHSCFINRKDGSIEIEPEIFDLIKKKKPQLKEVIDSAKERKELQLIGDNKNPELEVRK